MLSEDIGAAGIAGAAVGPFGYGNGYGYGYNGLAGATIGRAGCGCGRAAHALRLLAVLWQNGDQGRRNKIVGLFCCFKRPPPQQRIPPPHRATDAP
ncbi:jg17023 [Pararge aegeria aegeria]|uniref:Jg17023 protein n=1 Tax=Pararge aegeria aegeria TaxID=348720 RepID=A0A8S4R0U9_9NEOP|nr:jg17023 [Pararge aegeria aegeria]